MEEHTDETKILASKRDKKSPVHSKNKENSEEGAGIEVVESFSYQTFSNPPDLILAPRGHKYLCDEEFSGAIQDAVKAINKQVYPVLIKQGSSGSYFVKNCQDVGVSSVTIMWKLHLSLPVSMTLISVRVLVSDSDHTCLCFYLCFVSDLLF